MNIQNVLAQHKIFIETAGKSGEKADLSGADLSGADLCEADLFGADLRGANLRGADLCEADLRHADLRGADLRGAKLPQADLRDADLRDADLRSADLRRADLRGADLRHADLRGAVLPETTFIITGEKYFIQVTSGHLRAGCQSHSAEAWRKFTKADIAEMDGKDALRFYPRLLDILDFYLGKGERPEWVCTQINS